MNKTIVFSIKPVYIKKIFSKEKKFELRKQKPKIDKGIMAIIYSTSPSKKFIGHFTVGQIIEDEILKLWNYYHNSLGISYNNYMNYFSEKKKGVAIEIVQPILWKKNISLELIRQHILDYHPPQSYSYLSEDDKLWRIIKDMNPYYDYLG
jgi:predicted transcriptional regulator